MANPAAAAAPSPALQYVQDLVAQAPQQNPSLHLSTLFWKFFYIVWIHVKSFGDCEKIAACAQRALERGDLAVEDIHLFRPKDLRRFTFLQIDVINRAICATPLLAKQVALARLAILRREQINQAPPPPAVDAAPPPPPPPPPVDAVPPVDIAPVEVAPVDDAPVDIAPPVDLRAVLHELRQRPLYREAMTHARTLASPYHRRENRTLDAPEAHPERLVLNDLRRYLALEPPDMPAINHVEFFAGRIDHLVNAARNRVMRCFNGLGIMEQLYLFELMNNLHLGDFRDAIVDSFRAIFDQIGLSAQAVKLRIVAYLDLHKDDPVVAARYTMLLEALPLQDLLA